MSLLWVALIGIVALLVLVMGLRLHAFVSLLIVSIGVGLAAGMPLTGIIGTIEKGMGGTLGSVAIIVGLGSMFGAMLEVTGGAQRIARSLVKWLGEDKAPWALAATGFLVSIPVFLDVAFIILVPIVFSIARQTKRSTLHYAIPLLAGLAVTHTFVPPTPGPVAVAATIGADLGKVILYGILAGVPTTIVAGVIFGRYIGNKVNLSVPEWVEDKGEELKDEDLPAFGTVVGLILLPIVLILGGSVAKLYIDPLVAANMDVPLHLQIVSFLGTATTALIIATLAAFYILGSGRKMTLAQIQQVASKSLGPAGMIILVTGAGGVFKQVLIDSGIGQVMADSLGGLGLSPLWLAFVIACVVRVAQGSATVAMMTTAGFMAPILNAFPDVDKAWVTIAIAAGATIASHVNDSGFWLVKQYLGMDEKTTLKTWTVMETLVAVVGFIFVLIFSTFI